MRYVLAVATMWAVVGCSPVIAPVGLPPADPCAGQTCSGQGTCAVVNGTAAVCLCKAGFFAEGLACNAIVAGAECSGVTCGGRGSCVVLVGTPNTPKCECNADSVSTGPTTCAPRPVTDGGTGGQGTCAGVTCSGAGVCAVANNLPVCVCNPGYQPSGNLSCAAIDDACARQTCSGHGTCAANGQNPSCTCDSGYRLEAGSMTRCVPTTKTISFVSASRRVLEDQGTFVIPIEVSETLTASLTVPLATMGTATSGADYTPLPATRTVPQNLNYAGIAVTITDDTATETDEQIIITLTAPPGWTLGANPTFTLTILDNESANFGPRLCTQWGLDGDDTVSSMAVDSQQRVYVGGRSDGNLYGPQASGQSVRTYGDPTVGSYNADGGLRWGVQWGGAEGENITALKLDPSEQSLFVTVQASTSTAAELRRLSAVDGTVLWSQNWVGAWVSGLELSPNGRVVVAGTNWLAGFDGQTPIGESDLYVASRTSDGADLWTRFVGSTARDRIGGIAVDQASNIYLCGTVAGSVDNQAFGRGACGRFNSRGNPTNTSTPCTDAVLVKFSPTGQKLWTKQWGIDANEGCDAVRVNSQGVILAAGFSEQARTLTRFDANGNQLTTRADSMYVPGKFFLDAQDNVYFGSSTELVKFDPTGNTVLSVRNFLKLGMYLGVQDFVFGPAGTLYVAGASSNYCNAPSPPGTANNGFWALYGP
jgi:hypothetical protein